MKKYICSREVNFRRQFDDLMISLGTVQEIRDNAKLHDLLIVIRALRQTLALARTAVSFNPDICKKALQVHQKKTSRTASGLNLFVW